MIPRPYITEWRSHASWRDDAQVEQDLILSRLIIEFYNEPVLAENLCFSYVIESAWFSGKSLVKTYSLEELLGCSARQIVRYRGC